MSTREELAAQWVREHGVKGEHQTSLDVCPEVAFEAGYDAGTARLRELEGALRDVLQGGWLYAGTLRDRITALLEGSPSAKSGAPEGTEAEIKRLRALAEAVQGMRRFDDARCDWSGMRSHLMVVYSRLDALI